MTKLEIVGKSEIRVDGLSKVTGRAIYPADLMMEGMVYGKTLRSIKPHAYIDIDTSKAQSMEGVIRILTAKDVPYNHHGVLWKDQEVFCSKKVRRVGDPIAFVVAVTEKAAQRALSAIVVDYEDMEPVFDPVKAMKVDSPKVHNNSNLVYHSKIRKGNVEEAFPQCAIIIEKEYRTPMVEHAFLQPESGLAYLDDEGKIVICAATQYPHFDQEEVAMALNIPRESVKIINPAVGGAFGGREDITMQIHIALAARLTGIPVKVTYSREESCLAHSKRHSMIMNYKTGADKDGRLIAMEANVIGDTGAYASWAVNIIRKAVVHATGPYEIPNVKVDGFAVYTNNPFAGAMRGFGATQVPVAYEQQMDLLAEKLGMDPITIRLINGFKPGSITATGQLLNESVPLGKCIEAVAAALNVLPGGR